VLEVKRPPPHQELERGNPKSNFINAQQAQ